MKKTIIIFLFILLWAIYPVSATTYTVTPQGGAFPISVGADIPGNVFMDDIDEDGYGEIIVETYDNLFVYDHTGSIVWSKGLSRPHLKAIEKFGSPVAGDIIGDSELEVLTSGRVSNRLYAWNSTGSVLPGFPKTLAGYAYSTPALADVDNDGLMEIAVGCDGNKLYLIDGDGSDFPGWPVSINGGVHSEPAFGDIDNDNELEIVVNALDNNIYAFNLDGSNVTGWPQSIAGYGVYFEYQSPAVADIDNDGIDEVVVSATTLIMHNFFTGKLIAFEGDGTYLWTYNTNYNSKSSPVIGNIDDDPYQEIMVGSLYYMYAVDHDGIEKWSVNIGDEIFSVPRLMDVTGDGYSEVFAAAKNGKVYAWTGNGTAFMENTTTGQIRGSPYIYDFDDDGFPEAVVGTYVTGEMHAWNIEYIQEESGSSSGSGKSSGGAGGGTGEDFKNIEVTESKLQFVVMDERVSYVFQNGDPIVKVEFLAVRNGGSVNAVVEVLRDTSSMVSIPPRPIVYKNINIYVGLYGYATEQNIRDAVVTFKVRKEWIDLNDIGKSTIALYRFTDGTWIEQATKRISEDETYVYYEAYVQGFDNFAISGKKEDKKIIPGVDELGTKLTNIINTQNADSTGSPRTDRTYLYGGLLAAGLVIVLIIVYQRNAKK